LKWVGFVVAGFAALACIAIAYVFFASQREIDREYAVAETLGVPVPTEAAEIAEGKRLAHIVGCTDCHEQTLTGAALDIPKFARFVAPNVSAIAPTYTDAELATLLRRGVRRDHKGIWFMPTEMLAHLSDADLARIIAWVRTVPSAEGITGKTEIRPLGRFVVAMGEFKSGAAGVKSADIDQESAQPASRGRYLVMNACTECHGQDLGGDAQAHSPPLTVVKGYPPEAFAKLMHEGTALGGRTLELMSSTAISRFSSFTPDEVSAIYAFLKSR
jgi:cytochrome c553